LNPSFVLKINLNSKGKQTLMLNSKKLEEIAQQISDAVPPSMKTVAEGAEAKVKQVLQSQISRLDFVSREEFDIQSQVLMRTREKLEALETRLAKLEKPEA
jgi:BMFP domain-containing protein YqiC